MQEYNANSSEASSIQSIGVMTSFFLSVYTKYWPQHANQDNFLLIWDEGEKKVKLVHNIVYESGYLIGIVGVPSQTVIIKKSAQSFPFRVYSVENVPEFDELTMKLDNVKSSRFETNCFIGARTWVILQFMNCRKNNLDDVISHLAGYATKNHKSINDLHELVRWLWCVKQRRLPGARIDTIPANDQILLYEAKMFRSKIRLNQKARRARIAVWFFCVIVVVVIGRDLYSDWIKINQKLENDNKMELVKWEKLRKDEEKTWGMIKDKASYLICEGLPVEDKIQQCAKFSS